MRVLKSGSNKGCSEFYYSIGFNLGDWFNEVHCASYEKSIPEAVEMTAEEFGESVEGVSVRKIRTNTRRVIWEKSGAEF